MYLRTIQRHNKDGSTVRYVQLAHNHRKGTNTQAEVLVHLGREDRLDMDGLRRLVSSISRYLDGTGTLPPTADAGQDQALAVESSRTLGAVWLLDGLWQRLGVAEALGEVLGGRRFTTDVERVLFALVANRAVDPMSKLSAAEWASHDAAIPRLAAAGMADDQAYRAMDLLVAADAQARVQEAVFFAAAHLLNLEVDLLFFDTTSTFFERDTEEGGPGAFRVYGHSKDHRPDLPQIVIGLAVTREGIPVRVWCWPGSTNDQTVLKQVKDDLGGWRLGRVVTVVDRGFSSDDNLAYLTRAGGHWIAGERLRDGRADVAAVLARPGRYQTVRDNLRVKEVRLGRGDVARRFVLCHNPEQAERDRTQREQAIARLEAELERIATLRAKAARHAKAKTAANGRRRGAQQQADADDHLKAECALRDHPTLGRWLRQTPGGRLVIDRAKLKAEARLDGKFLVSTSDPDLSAEDIALGYKNLLEAERAFRDLKTTLELRPVWHRLERRIHAHVLLCWLALLLVRVAERQTGQTWRRINLELGRLHLVTLSGPAGRVEQTTALTSIQRELFTAIGITPPPRVTSLQPG